MKNKKERIESFKKLAKALNTTQLRTRISNHVKESTRLKIEMRVIDLKVSVLISELNSRGEQL
jgi:hypothetical protein